MTPFAINSFKVIETIVMSYNISFNINHFTHLSIFMHIHILKAIENKDLISIIILAAGMNMKIS